MLMDLDAGARVKYLIHDREASFGAAFDMVFTATGIDVIRTGVRAPRQNAIVERWFRSLRAELTDRTQLQPHDTASSQPCRGRPPSSSTTRPAAFSAP